MNALLLLYPMNLNWNGMKTHWHFDYAIKMLEAPLSVPEGFGRCQPGPVSLSCLHSHSSGSARGTRARAGEGGRRPLRPLKILRRRAE